MYDEVTLFADQYVAPMLHKNKAMERVYDGRMQLVYQLIPKSFLTDISNILLYIELRFKLSSWLDKIQLRKNLRSRQINIDLLWNLKYIP